MPALDLTTVAQFPFVSSTTTPSTANLCRIILLPEAGSMKITIHNRDKGTKGLAFSFDQTLTDGGAAPATYFSVDDPFCIKVGPNRRTGFAKVTQVAVFAPSHTAVGAEIMLEEGDL